MKYNLELSVVLYFICILDLGRSQRPPFHLCDENTTRIDTYRLPESIVPYKYVIDIRKNLFSYDGHVSIYLKALKKTDTIILHNDGLRILKESVTLHKVLPDINEISEEHLVCYFYDAERQFYGIKTYNDMYPTRDQLEVYYVLRMWYTGEIRDDVFGFYRSSYVANNETKWMAVTQFSPTFARRAFPCMDEPHLKAVFQVNINADEQSVMTNAELDHISNSKEYHFKETPRMSTYLVGFAMHDFVSESAANSSQNFRIWTRGSMNHLGWSALNLGRSIYSFLSNWFRIENDIPKMDHVAVPDFNFNAMENWGMITFRESVVLHDDDLTPIRYTYQGLTTMAHEYAHTWFGNLVTPAFWDVAWLKEGFATYFQYFALSAIQPDWEAMNKFVVDVLQQALLLDSSNSDRAMNGRCDGSPKSAMAMLDFVSYKKSASVIRMISHVVGESAFQEGLRNYLIDRAHKAAAPADLYRNLEKSVNKPGEPRVNASIRDIMETWANHPGYPLVSVIKNSGNLIISQEHFHLNRQEQSSTEWWVPLSFVTEKRANFSETAPSHWLRPGVRRLTIEDAAPDDGWVILNVRQIGYYRVNYDQENWQRLIRYLNSEEFYKIDKLNRAALIDDAFNLARAGYLDYAVPFDLCRYLARERDYEPWVAAANNFKFVHRMLGTSNRTIPMSRLQAAFENYAVDLLENMYRQLNFTESAEEDLTTKLKREIILSTSCLFRSPDCLNTALNIFLRWSRHPNETIPRDIKSFVLCEGFRHRPSEWPTIMERYLKTDLQTEQELLLQAFGCTLESSQIRELVTMAISNDYNKHVRKQQRIMAMNAAIDGNGWNADFVLELVQKHLRLIITERGYDFLDKVITAIGNAMIADYQVETLRAFVRNNSKSLGPSLSSAEKALSIVSENAEWIRRYKPNIAKYFEINV